MQINKDKVIYSFSSENKPVARVRPGERVEFITDDCFRSQIKSENDSVASLDWDQINPATGPLYIEEAQPGDFLKIELLEVEVESEAVMVAAPEEGVLGDLIEEPVTRVFPIKNGYLNFSERINIPIEPMIGVIGTAPAKGAVPNGTPGVHGGNMDCKEIKQGATLYLPVNTPGALLAMGDLHAVMGDGEIVVCGGEARGRVLLQVDLLHDFELPLPLLENNEKLITIASAETLDEAVEMATKNMAQLLVKITDHSLAEVGMLLSLVGDAMICQVVDPLKTARFEINKKYLFIDKLSDLLKG